MPVFWGGALGSGLFQVAGSAEGLPAGQTLGACPWSSCASVRPRPQTSLLDSLSPQHHQLLLFSASRHLRKRSLMKEPPLFLFQIWLLLGTWPFLHQPGACRQEPLLHCLRGSPHSPEGVVSLGKTDPEPGWQSPQGRDRKSDSCQDQCKALKMLRNPTVISTSFNHIAPSTQSR